MTAKQDIVLKPAKAYDLRFWLTGRQIELLQAWLHAAETNNRLANGNYAGMNHRQTEACDKVLMRLRSALRHPF